MFDLDSVKELFKTEPNTAFFWSGLGENGAEIAKETAKANGGVTLEMLMEQNKQKLIEAGFPYDEDFDRFIWNGSEQPATLVELKSNAVVRFRWDDAEEEDEYFEFNIHVEPLTGDVALIITDFADEDEVNDTIELWNKQMDILHRNLGA